MLTLILWTIAIGCLIGFTIVFLIIVKQGQENVNSLSSLESALGLWGTVEIPFDAKQRGKIRVVVRGSALDLVAFTDDPQGFKCGDRVLVVEAHKNGVWVVAANAPLEP